MLASVISFVAFHCFVYFVFAIISCCLFLLWQGHCGFLTFYACVCVRVLFILVEHLILKYLHSTYIYVWLLTFLCACILVYCCCMHLDIILLCQCFLVFGPKVLTVKSKKCFVLYFLVSFNILVLNSTVGFWLILENLLFAESKQRTLTICF